MGDAETTSRFFFEGGFFPGGQTVNVERASFDAMLLEHARKAGAMVRENVTVRRIVRLADGDVEVIASSERLANDRRRPDDPRQAIEQRQNNEQRLTARWLIDASGQGTVVARYLGTRQQAPEKHLQKVAYFAHFEGVERLSGREAGHPAILMCDEGWFWIIHIDEQRTSVGLVIDTDAARSLGVPPDRMLAWGIARCPQVRDRMTKASGPQKNMIAADYSYRCRPYAGPGYFLVGDAAAFVDPIFSTGVCLAMMSGVKAAEAIGRLIDKTARASGERRKYIRYIEGSTSIFFWLIRQYYNQSFRELFLNGTGPARVHKAVLATLAGHVFPRPAFALRWRLWLFWFYIQVQRFFPIVPRRANFSLLRNRPVDCAMTNASAQTDAPGETNVLTGRAVVAETDVSGEIEVSAETDVPAETDVLGETEVSAETGVPGEAAVVK
jgi:flavin-dependent dehydrogenase